MSQSRAKILDMLAKGKITPEEAERLLEKVDAPDGEEIDSNSEVEDQAGPADGLNGLLGGLGDMLGGNKGSGKKKGGLGGLDNLMDRVGKITADAKRQATSSSASGGPAYASGGKASASASATGRGSSASAAGFAGGSFSSGGGKATYGVSSQTSSSSSMVEETREMCVDHVPQKPLEVRTINGGVQVARSERGDVGITTRIKCESRERLENTRIEASRGSDGTLALSVAWPGGNPKPSEGCEFTIEIPDAHGIDIGTANGPISVSQMSGNTELKSANGSISVREQAGSVRAQTTNGSIELSTIAGEAVAHTNNGKIGIVDVTGSIEAITRNAKVDLELEDDNPGPFRIETSNGSIRLALGSDFNGEVEVGTSNASVKLEESSRVQILSKERTSAVLQVGEGGDKSVAKTSNGSIRVEFED